MQNAENFNDYLMLLKLSQDTCTENAENTELFSRLHIMLLEFVQRPDLFNNFEELFEVDKLHQIQYERISQTFIYERSPTSRKKYRLNIFFINF